MVVFFGLDTGIDMLIKYSIYVKISSNVIKPVFKVFNNNSTFFNAY